MVQKLSLAVVTSLPISVPVGYKQIQPTVIVIVEKLCSPTDVRKTNLGDLRLEGDVSKRIVAVVVIENVVLVVEIGYEQIQPSVMVVIAKGHSHGTLLSTALVYSRA